jgi:hypothetical protein
MKGIWLLMIPVLVVLLVLSGAVQSIKADVQQIESIIQGQ